jgi:hypothetical protein
MEDESSGQGPADLYAQLARIGKVGMHPKRIELLDLLCQVNAASRRSPQRAASSSRRPPLTWV